jgi:CRP-like cAMP-binding protein
MGARPVSGMTIIERVLLLQGVDLLEGVTTEQLSFIAAISQDLSIGPGEVLYKEGDPPNGLYVVVSGGVDIIRNNEKIDKIGPSGSFGVWALFDGQPRLTAARTAEATQLLFVAREEFYDVLADHVDITQAIFKQLVQRVRRLASATEK